MSDSGLRPQPLVLVIDDSATFRAALGQALRAAGYAVEASATGEEGLRAASRLRPDVIVVDRVLPDLDGTAVIRNIRLDTAVRRTPCLLVTADEDPSVEFTALETGADAYVQKDADISVLLARVAALQRDAPRPADASGTGGRRRVIVIATDWTTATARAAALPANEYDVSVLPAASAATLAMASAFDAIVVSGGGLASIKDAIAVVRPVVRERHVPLRVRAAQGSAGVAAAALLAGADDYVVATSDPALYIARLRAIIRRKDVDAEDRRITEELMRHDSEVVAARLRADMAEQENEFKSRFLAIMSHELRTPLNAILGFTQLLDRGVGGDLSTVQRRHVNGVVRSAEHLLALVNDVLDLSAIRAGRLTLRRGPVSLADAAESARLTVAPLAGQREIRLTIGVPAGLPPVMGDSVRIQQILFNLLSNGIKFTDRGGAVTLRAARDGAAVRLSVQDTGIGIKPEDMGRLFKEFERLEDTRLDRAEGTGLGLSLTRHLVELHGGRIEVESAPGRGTEFAVWLPIVSDQS
jgi:signal transduction histidine kinase/CheY-like chemotaxis protein